MRRSARAAGVSDRLRFRGFQSDVWPWLEAADIVVVPSVASEPFGNTAVEAVLAARPVVAADHSGLREAVEGCGGAQRVDTRAPDAAARLADAAVVVRADWPRFSAAALADAAVARGRHDPRAYGRRVAEAVTGTPVRTSRAADGAPLRHRPSTLVRKERQA